MTQFQHTLRQLLLGDKTETSRIVKPGDYTWMCGEMPAPWIVGRLPYVMQYSAIHSAEHVARFRRGQDYAIQPDRTSKSVGRYRVEAIWRQDVRTLTHKQARNEGFLNTQQFFDVWCWMHDKEAFKRYGFWQRDAERLNVYPTERYTAWRMTISVLWDTIDWDAPVVRALQIEPKAVY